MLTTAVAVLSITIPFTFQSPVVNELDDGNDKPAGATVGGSFEGRPKLIVAGSFAVSTVSLPSFVPLLLKSVSSMYLLVDRKVTFNVQSFFIALPRSDVKSLYIFQTSFSKLLYLEKLFKRIKMVALIIPMIISANDISIIVKPFFVLIYILYRL